MLVVVFRRSARDEFRRAALWYEEQLPGLGRQFVVEVDRAIARVRRRPLTCPEVHEGVRRAVTRRFPFAIYFRVRADAIVVLAVFHGRRDPAVWQRRA